VKVSVLVIGAGPVGLALAIELGRYGVECLVVDRRGGEIDVPRMSGLSVRGMEFNRRWGIARKAERLGWPMELPNDFVYCTSLTGFELARARIPSYRDRKVPFSPEKPCGCAQIYYDPLLAERVRSLPSVTLRYRTRLDGFTQDERGVHARLVDVDGGAVTDVDAAFLVGCDGSSSTVAAALDIPQEGQGTIGEAINVYFRSPELATVHDKGWARFFRFTDAGGSWGEVVGIDGKELWRLTTFSALGMSRPTEADGAALIRRLAGVDVPHAIVSSAAWQRRDVVAASYRSGRAFLAGDSAHVHSPTGGLGLHTGLIDAVDLGWKLAATLAGWGGARLLDSYEAERKPLAMRSVSASTKEFQAITRLPGAPAIAEATPAGEEARRRFVETFRAAAPTAHFNENLRTGYCYEDSPICVQDGTEAPPADAREFIPSARPGTRAPHAWLDADRSMLDLFGEGFVLLRLGAEPPEAGALVDAAHARGVPLSVVDVPQGAVRDLYERSLVLVRPDGHVAWRGDQVPVDALAVVDRVRGA